MLASDFKERLRVLADDDATLAQMLQKHKVDRFNVVEVSERAQSVSWSVMPKPVDTPTEHVLFWVWYWDYAFSEEWDLDQVDLHPDAMANYRRLLSHYLDDWSPEPLDPEKARDEISSIVCGIKNRRSDLVLAKCIDIRDRSSLFARLKFRLDGWLATPYETRKKQFLSSLSDKEMQALNAKIEREPHAFSVRRAGTDAVTTDLNDSPLQSEFLQATQLHRSYCQETIFFETNEVLGLWNWHLTA